MDPGLGEGPLGELHDAAIAFDGDTITWVGRSADAPDAPDVVSYPGTVGLPGLVEVELFETRRCSVVYRGE